MQTITIGKLKANFSEILKKVSAGETIAIAYGRKKEVVAKIVPQSIPQGKRKLGVLEGNAKVVFGKQFSINEEEFLGQ